MSATDAPAELRAPVHPAPPPDAGADSDDDELAAARGVVLGALLGAAALGLLALAFRLLL